MLAHRAAPNLMFDTVSWPAISPRPSPVGSNHTSQGSISPRFASYVNCPIIDRVTPRCSPGGVVASQGRSHVMLRRRTASHVRMSRLRNGASVTPPYEMVAGQECSAG